MLSNCVRFVTRMHYWDVVDVTFAHMDQTLQISFVTKDNLSREAILSGVSTINADMICQEDTARAMWKRFVDKQTKREYSNYIFARAKFYSNAFTMDKSMDQWLYEMESL